MERNTLTHVYKLNFGDRFYKVKDRSKKVYEMVEAEKKVTPFRTYSYWAKTDNSDELVALKGNTEVIFLRHNENVPIVPKEAHRRLKPSLEHYTLMQKLNAQDIQNELTQYSFHPHKLQQPMVRHSEN